MDVLVLNNGGNTFDVAVCQKCVTNTHLNIYDGDPKLFKQSGKKHASNTNNTDYIFMYLGSSSKISDLTRFLTELEYRFNKVATIWNPSG